MIDETAANAWWKAFRDQKTSFFAQQPLWRLAVKARTPALDIGPTAFDLGGEVRWVQAQAQPSAIRKMASEAGGHATLFRWDNVQQTPPDGVFQPLDRASIAVIKRLKEELDPKSIFNVGRLVAGI